MFSKGMSASNRKNRSGGRYQDLEEVAVKLPQIDLLPHRILPPIGAHRLPSHAQAIPVSGEHVQACRPNIGIPVYEVVNVDTFLESNLVAIIARDSLVILLAVLLGVGLVRLRDLGRSGDVGAVLAARHKVIACRIVNRGIVFEELVQA